MSSKKLHPFQFLALELLLQLIKSIGGAQTVTFVERSGKLELTRTESLSDLAYGAFGLLIEPDSVEIIAKNGDKTASAIVDWEVIGGVKQLEAMLMAVGCKLKQ